MVEGGGGEIVCGVVRCSVGERCVTVAGFVGSKWVWVFGGEKGRV